MHRSLRFTPRGRSAAVSAVGALVAIVAMAVPGAAMAENESLHGVIHNWTLKGSVTDKAINQTIALPTGCTFNGELTLPGSLEGNTACPPFSANASVLGISSTLGLTLTESRAVSAAITEPVENSGNFVLNGSAADVIGVTSVKLFGLAISTSCKTSSAVTFPLASHETGAELFEGTTFTGTATIPSITCSGGLLGAAFGPVLTTLMSGSGNPFTLTVARGTGSALAPTAEHTNYAVPYGAEAMLDFGERFLLAPTYVTGANNGCRPSAEHPYPVVLVHGTWENEGDNWVTLAPLLSNAGYCVYAFNYGEGNLSFGGRIDGINHIANSAAELGTFVNSVLAQSGASKVDIVGHSQGGMMPNYYISKLGGASKVADFVGLAPSNHGTTLSGVTELLTYLRSLPVFGLITTSIEGLVAKEMPAALEQEIGSPFMTELFGSGDPIAAGVKYTVIETSHDEVVTPYTNAFLHDAGVTNILVQEQCPSDPTGHVGMIEDSPALQNVLNQLSSSPVANFKATCSNYGIGL
jgi:hypothetical protein